MRLLQASVPYRPVGDAAIPGLAAIERAGKAREWAEGDLTRVEDRVSRWTAFALFGGLVAVEGGLFTWFADGIYYAAVGVAFVLVGGLIFTVGSLVVPELGGGYGYAVFAAAALAVALGAWMGVHPLSVPATVGSLWFGGHPAEEALAWTIRGMEVGGTALFGLGVAQATRLYRQLRRA